MGLGVTSLGHDASAIAGLESLVFCPGDKSSKGILSDLHSLVDHIDPDAGHVDSIWLVVGPPL